jgi:hypothetical protein
MASTPRRASTKRSNALKGNQNGRGNKGGGGGGIAQNFPMTGVQWRTFQTDLKKHLQLTNKLTPQFEQLTTFRMTNQTGTGTRTAQKRGTTARSAPRRQATQRQAANG